MLEHKKWMNLVPQVGVWHHVAIIRFTYDRTSQLHDHDFAEVFWIERGSGRHHVNGQVRRLDAGDLIFVRPQDQHRLEAVDASGFTLINLAYSDRVRRDLVRSIGDEARSLLAPKDALPTRWRLPLTALTTFRRRIERLSQSPTSRLALEYVLTGLLETIRLESLTEMPPMPEWLRQACEAVKHPEVFAQGASGMVRVAGRSHEHVSRSLRHVLGITPSQYVNSVRMEYAARELRVTARPITEIALDCGVSNLSHFYALFRASHDHTPRAYRLRHHRTVV